jgi:Cohesin domain.
MKRHFKSLCGIILTLFILLGSVAVNSSLTVHADSVDVSISVSSSSVRIGQSVSATVSVSSSSLSAYTLYVSYDSSILEYAGATGTVGGGGGTLIVSGTGPGSTTISFTAIANGSAYIGTSGDEFYDINYEVLEPSHAGVSITVETTEDPTTEEKTDDEKDKEDKSEDKTETTTEEDKRSNDCDLADLSVSPGALSPEFSPSNTSYTVTLTEDDQSIAISAITNDEKATTSVYGANSLQKGVNSVSITVTAENGAEKVYYLTVICGEENEDMMLKVEGHNFIVVTEDLPEAPEGFTEATFVLSNKDVPGFESPNKRLAIICLRDEEGEKHWYIYDKNANSFQKYNEFTAKESRYVIMKKPDSFDVPKGFNKADLKIDNSLYPAYSDGSGSGIYLVYAMNLNGEAGYYFYDTKEGSFMRFAAAESLIATIADAEKKVEPATIQPATEAATVAPVIPQKAENEDSKGISRSTLKYLLIAMTVLFVIMCMAVIALVIRNANLQNKIDGEENAGDDDDTNASEDSGEGSDDNGSEAASSADAGAEQQGAAEAEVRDTGKNMSYGVNDDTGEIQLEAASDFNSSVNVPLAKEEREDRIENAKKERPFGIDSAFEVVPEPVQTEAAEATEKSVKETKREVPKKKVVLPGQDDEEE